MTNRTNPQRAAAAAALVLATTVSAQTGGVGAPAASPERAVSAPAATPRIGLALSGGGARGIAHVGVLKVLEEMRIPISCVTGTSMGAIVGGAYAAGRTAEDMEKRVLAADWPTIFRDSPPRKEIAVRRKMDDYLTLFKPEFGVKDGLALPKGIIAGVSIETFFRDLSTPAFGVSDFNKLPIPFRAMATDIETGESVVLDEGSLSQAMRASMSVPGAIAPVEIDGKLLVDGGIANNLPIDEARKLCGEVIIAVNISTPPLKRDEITSALSVTAQLINFLGKQTVDQQLRSLGPNDVLISPELGDITAGSFDRSKDAIKIGEDATRALADKLKRYSVSPEQYAALRSRQVTESKALGTVDEIRIEGLKRTNPAVAQTLVESKPGEPLTEEKLGADLRRIYGTRDFESISYRIVGGETGPRALVIEPVEKSWGPDYLRFGLGLQADFAGESQFNALVQYRKSWLNQLGAEWITHLQIGQDTHLATEFVQPLNQAGKWFVAPSAYIGQQTRNVFVGEDNVADYLTSVTQGGLAGGAVLGTWGLLRAGYTMSRVYARVDTGSPLLPSVRETTAGLRAALFIDQTDNAFFSRAGYGLTGTGYFAMESLGSEVSYSRVEASGRAIKSWGAHTLNASARGGSSLGSDTPFYESFTLGGPLQLSAYRINEFSGRRYAFGRLMYYNRTLPLPDLLGSGVYVGASGEVGRVSDRVNDLPTPGTVWSSSVFLGADTALGPAYFGVGVGSGRWSLYLLLGAP